MNINPKRLAIELIEKGYNSDPRSINQLTPEIMEENLQYELGKLFQSVLQEMQELEHPEPRNREEYNERYGLDKE